MSQQERDALVANPNLSFTDASQSPDLQSELRTNTYLVALLQHLLDNCTEPVEVLAVRSDHTTPDGPWAHSGGMAVDLYPKNWEGREQTAVCNVLKALSENPYCEAVGLGGVTQQWITYVTWPSARFVVFYDNTADHIHCGCANAVDPPGARLAG